jgi:hypothetical protein
MLHNKIEKIDFLRFCIGNPQGKGAELIIDKGFLYISECFGYFKEILQSPDKKIAGFKEKELISSLEEIGFENWKENYCNEEILEGTEWELEMKINNEQKHYYFSGHEEYPSKKGDSKVFRYSKEFKKLLNALNLVSNTKYFA